LLFPLSQQELIWFGLTCLGNAQNWTHHVSLRVQFACDSIGLRVSGMRVWHDWHVNPQCQFAGLTGPIGLQNPPCFSPSSIHFHYRKKIKPHSPSSLHLIISPNFSILSSFSSRIFHFHLFTTSSSLLKCTWGKTLFLKFFFKYLLCS
jgi:hypothetical protein